MNPQALQSVIGSGGLTAADYRGMTADQVRQTQQIGMQQTAMMAQIMDAMQGRQLQREQMQQMERQYEHQREMAQKQFELMQNQEVRAQVNQAFSMFATKASHELEKRRLTLEEQFKGQQMSLTGLQIQQMQKDMKQAEATMEMMNRLNTIQIPIAGGTVPLGVVVLNDNLSKIYMEQLKAQSSASSNLPTGEQEIMVIAERIMHNSGGKVPREAALIEARILNNMKDIPSLTDFASMVDSSYRLKNLFSEPDDIRKFWEATMKMDSDLRAAMEAGDGPYARKYSRRFADVDPGLLDDPVQSMKETIAMLEEMYPEATQEEIYEAIKDATGVHPLDILNAPGLEKPGHTVRQPIVR